MVTAPVPALTARRRGLDKHPLRALRWAALSAQAPGVTTLVTPLPSMDVCAAICVAEAGSIHEQRHASTSHTRHQVVGSDSIDLFTSLGFRDRSQSKMRLLHQLPTQPDHWQQPSDPTSPTSSAFCISSSCPQLVRHTVVHTSIFTYYYIQTAPLAARRPTDCGRSPSTDPSPFASWYVRVAAPFIAVSLIC